MSGASETAPRRTCFIYAITHTASGKRYVGSSVDPHYRWIKHRCELNGNKHHCRHLQNAWNKYGACAFTFSIIETLASNDRVPRAQAELRAIAAATTYNSRKASLGLTNFVNSEETRLRISAGLNRLLLTDDNYKANSAARGANLARWARLPENRVRQSILSASHWKDPHHRSRVSKSLAKHWSTPGIKEEHSMRVKAYRSTVEARKHNSEITKAAWDDPNSGLRNRKQTRWTDPEAKARQSEKMKVIWAARRLLRKQATQAAELPLISADDTAC